MTVRYEDLIPTELDLIERLAALSHEEWSSWTIWMMEKWQENHYPDDEPFRQRWARQCQTSYAKLSEEEKLSDRQAALRMYEIFNAWIDEDPTLTPAQQAELDKSPALHCKPFLSKSLWHGLQQGVQWAVTKGGRELRDVRIIKPTQPDQLWCVLFMYREEAQP